MLVFGLIMVILALAGGMLMLWKIPLPRKFKSLGHLPMDLRLSVIIPARNEEKRLPPLLASLRRQDLPEVEIIVVDDESSDATVAFANEGGARVISSAEATDATTGTGKPWVGKSRACWAGALAARGDILVFLDADTRLDHSDSLRRLLLTFKKQGSSGIVSVQPYHQIRKFYESFSMVFNIIVMAGMNIFTPWGGKFRIAGAFGPCLVCRKDEYMACGGHAAVREMILDDFALGDLFIRKKLAVTGYGGYGLIHFRMYPEGFGQLAEGWTKNIASGAKRTHPLLLLMAVIWIGGAFSSIFLLVESILSGIPGWIITAVILCAAYMLQFIWLSRRTGNFHLAAIFIYPVLHLFFVLLYLWSLFRTKILHTVNWRGRRIKV
jgi:4,4'-diaponeurosporenoate glycosyltransferase